MESKNNEKQWIKINKQQQQKKIPKQENQASLFSYQHSLSCLVPIARMTGNPFLLSNYVTDG